MHDGSIELFNGRVDVRSAVFGLYEGRFCWMVDVPLTDAIGWKLCGIKCTFWEQGIIDFRPMPYEI
jgi:hypothetical protein